MTNLFKALTISAALTAALSVHSAYSQTAADAPAQPRRITADVGQITGPHSRSPLMVVGAGRANEGLRADWQAQLALVQREIELATARWEELAGSV